MTVSAYIVRTDAAEPLALVHMHRKLGKLLQMGGHIEIDETPWQTMAHELREESGYELSQLQVLQPDAEPVVAAGAVLHPVPVLMNTHRFSDTHYHSDLAYAFTTTELPAHEPAKGEATDLRWLSLAALKREVAAGVAARDVAVFYEAIMVRYLHAYQRVPATRYSLNKPGDASL